MPGEPRYPLYADEVPPPPPPGKPRWGNSAPVVVVLVGLLLMALAIPVGLWLLFSPADDPEPLVAVDTAEAGETATEEPVNTEEPTTGADAAPDTETEPSGSASPTAGGSGTPAAKPTKAPERTFTKKPAQLDGASADVPAVAPSSTDVRGARTTYGPENLFDNSRAAAWRMPGDGTGRTLTVTLPDEVQVTRVGLINGYAKSSEAGHDWYLGNRRIQHAEWIFEDGTTLRQAFGESRDLQFIDLPEPAVGRTVKLRLLAVSAPGTGSSARDYTAISEIRVIGRTG